MHRLTTLYTFTGDITKGHIVSSHHYQQRIRGRRVYGGEVNIIQGQHGGAIQAHGKPLQSHHVDGLSEVKSVDARTALTKAIKYLQMVCILFSAVMCHLLCC
jgi:hypothetical protein